MGYKCKLCGKNSKKIATCANVDIYECGGCGVHWSNQNQIEDVSSTSEYNDGLKTLEGLRRSNNERILKRLETLFEQKKGIHGLEVGCATGIFLEQAAKAGYQMYGIEPMDVSFDIAKGKGLKVFNGFFPDDMPEIAPVDFIIFNDVYEHIPNLDDVMKACQKYLKNNGYLIINLPDRRGILYKGSKLMNQLHDGSAYLRLWQLQTHSPHLYYFDEKSLSSYVGKWGFELKKPAIDIPAYQLKGLYNRICSVKINRVLAKVYWIMLCLAYPFLRILPSDTRCYFFQKIKHQER